MTVHTLIRIDSRPVPDCLDDVRAFMVVRDEMLRLPQTLDHHRKLGVGRFFAIDNGSTDGTKEFLLDQHDCHVFVTRNSYSKARCGVDWQHALLDEYGIGHWCLVIDADEWFVYPGCEQKPLAQLTKYLDRTGATGVFAFLIDMYGLGAISELVAVSHQRSLLESCPYFDNEYFWHSRVRIPGLQKPRFPPYNVTGGVRWRMLLPSLYRHYYSLWLMWHFTGYLGIKLPASLRSVPQLTKVPFVRWLPSTRYQNAHATTPINLSKVTAALLHFKFLGDFVQRVGIEVSRKEHWDNAGEYARYQTKLTSSPSLTLHYARSVAYEDSVQLVRLGLMREDEEWAEIRKVG